MRRIWSEENKRLLWRRLWVAMAEAQVDFGLVSAQQVQDLKDHASEIDIPGALQIEEKLHHDLMAEIKVYASQCKVGGGIIHLGATSMDIKDNAEVLQIISGAGTRHRKTSRLIGQPGWCNGAICCSAGNGVHASAAGGTDHARLPSGQYRAGSAG